jgi:Na+/H+-translocating membrane pyrophosphatase
MVAYFGG